MIPSWTPPPGRIEAKLLLVGVTGDELRSFENLLQEWTIYSVDSIREALAVLATDPVGVLVCRENLRDGRWSDLLHELEDLDSRPRMIVLSQCADEHLWAEVLRGGAYDLLATPLEPIDALRTISQAARAWQWREQPRVPRMAAVGA